MASAINRDQYSVDKTLNIFLFFIQFFFSKIFLIFFSCRIVTAQLSGCNTELDLKYQCHMWHFCNLHDLIRLQKKEKVRDNIRHLYHFEGTMNLKDILKENKRLE